MFDHVCPCVRLQSDNSVFVCLLLGVTSSNFSLLVYLIVGISMCLYSYWTLSNYMSNNVFNSILLCLVSKHLVSLSVRSGWTQ